MQFRTVLFLLVTCFLSLSALAQNSKITLNGSVTDVYGTPLMGANITIATLNIGTTAGLDGTYQLVVPQPGIYQVTFSYVGFKSQVQRIDFTTGSSVVQNIKLKEDAAALDAISIQTKSQIRQKREEAYAINVIDAAQLYNTSADINEVLDRTSGVRVRQNGGLGSDFTFSLNGFSGRQVKFFLDGIPIDNFGSSLTLNNYPVNLADRIEIYKGVLPIELGSDALGGAVNIITRDDANYLDASYGYGSFNTHRASLNAAYTHPVNGFTARLISFYNFSNNNYKVRVRPIDLQTNQRLPEQEVERFHDDYESATAQVEIGVRGKSYADELLIGFIASGNDRDIQTGVTQDQVFGARTASASAFIPTLKYRKKDLFTDGLDINFYGAYNNNRNQFIDTTRVRFNWLGQSIPSTQAEFFRTQLQNKDREAVTTTNLAYKIDERQGLSINHSFSNFKRTSSDIENPESPTLQFPQSLIKNIVGVAYQYQRERFKATAFTKAYFLNARAFVNNFGQSGDQAFTATQSSSTNYGYGAAASYFIKPRWQIKASYEQAYRLPQAVELLGDGLFTTRNANLRPESSDNFNLGMKYEFVPADEHRIQLEATYLLRLTNNFIQLNQASSQPVARQFLNIGQVTTNGLELNIQYDWKQQLTAGINLTYQDIVDNQEFITNTNLGGTVQSPNFNFGFRVPNIPYLYGNVNVDYAFAKANPSSTLSNNFKIGYSLNYVQEYFLTPNQLGANNQDNIPTQLSHSLRATYSLVDGKFNIGLELDNITDEELFDNYLLQRPGRAFFLNLRYYIDKPFN